VIESGQPYSVIDYTGAVGSIYYGTTDGITNPIVPLAQGLHRQQCRDGRDGCGRHAGAQGVMLHAALASAR
jgi:hypothetical protein